MSSKPVSRAGSRPQPQLAFTKVPSDHSGLTVAMRPVTRQRPDGDDTAPNSAVAIKASTPGPKLKAGGLSSPLPPRSSTPAASSEKYAWTFGASPLSASAGPSSSSRQYGVDFRPSTVGGTAAGGGAAFGNAHRQSTPANVGPSGKLLLTPIARRRQELAMAGAPPLSSPSLPTAATTSTREAVVGDDANDLSDPDEMRGRPESPPRPTTSRGGGEDGSLQHATLSSSSATKKASAPAHLKERLRLQALYPLANGAPAGRVTYRQGKRTQVQLMMGTDEGGGGGGGGGATSSPAGAPSAAATAGSMDMLFDYAEDGRRVVAKLAPALLRAATDSATTTTVTTMVGAQHDYFSGPSPAEAEGYGLNGGEDGNALNANYFFAQNNRNRKGNFEDDDGPDFSVQNRGTSPLPAAAASKKMRMKRGPSASQQRQQQQRAGTSHSHSRQGNASNINNNSVAVIAEERGLALAGPPPGSIDLPLHSDTRAFLAAELRYLNASDKAGRLGVYREAFVRVIDGFRAFGPLLEEIRSAYEDRLSELEELSKIALHGDPSVAIEKEKYLRLQDEALDAMEKGRAQKTVLRKRIVDAEQAKRDAVADVSAELSELRVTRVELNEKALQSGAAVRDLEEMLVTYTAANKELTRRIEAMHAEHAADNEDSHRHLRALQEELAKERAEHGETKKKAIIEIEALKQQAKALEDVHIAPDRYEAAVERANRLSEAVTALERRAQWLERDLAKKAAYEPPIDWSMTGPTALAAHEQFPEKGTEDLIRLLGNRVDRAAAAERELLGRWGHVLALSAMGPVGGYGATAANGGYGAPQLFSPSSSSAFGASSLSAFAYRPPRLFASSVLPQLPVLINVGQTWAPAVPLLQSAAAADRRLLLQNGGSSSGGVITAPAAAAPSPGTSPTAAASRKSVTALATAAQQQKRTSVFASTPVPAGALAAGTTFANGGGGVGMGGGGITTTSGQQSLSLAALAEINSFLVPVLMRPPRTAASASTAGGGGGGGVAFLTSVPPAGGNNANISASPLPNPNHLVGLLRHRRDVPEAWFVSAAEQQHQQMQHQQQQPYVSVYDAVPIGEIRETRRRLIVETQQCHPILNITPAVVRQLVAGAFVALTSNAGGSNGVPIASIIAANTGGGSDEGGGFGSHNAGQQRLSRAASPQPASSTLASAAAATSPSGPPMTFLEACDSVFRRYYERRTFSFYNNAAYPFYPNDWLDAQAAAHEADAVRRGVRKAEAQQKADAKVAAAKAAKTEALRAAIAALKKGSAPPPLPDFAGNGGAIGNAPATGGNKSPRGGQHGGHGNHNHHNSAALGSYLLASGGGFAQNPHSHALSSNAPNNSNNNGKGGSNYGYAPHHAQTGALRYPPSPSIEDSPSFAHVVATILHIWGQLSVSEPFFRTALQVLTAAEAGAEGANGSSNSNNGFVSVFAAAPPPTEETWRGYSNSFVNILRASVGRLLRLQLDRSNEPASASSAAAASSGGGGGGGGSFGAASPPAAAGYCPTTTDGASIALVPCGLTVTDIINTLSADVLSKTPDQWAVVRGALTDQLAEQYRQMCALYVGTMAAAGVDAKVIAAAVAAAPITAATTSNSGGGSKTPSPQQTQLSSQPSSVKPFAVFASPPLPDGQSADDALNSGGDGSPLASPKGQPQSLSATMRASTPATGGASTSASQGTTPAPTARGGGGGANGNASAEKDRDGSAAAPSALLSAAADTLYGTAVVALPTPDSFASRRHYLQPSDVMGYPTIGEASPLLMALLDQFWGDAAVLAHCVSSVINEYIARGGGGGVAAKVGRSAAKAAAVGAGNLLDGPPPSPSLGAIESGGASSAATPSPQALARHVGEGVTINQAIALVRHCGMAASASHFGGGGGTAALAAMGAADDVLAMDMARQMEGDAVNCNSIGPSALERAFAAAEAEMARLRGGGGGGGSGALLMGRPSIALGSSSAAEGVGGGGATPVSGANGLLSTQILGGNASPTRRPSSIAGATKRPSIAPPTVNGATPPPSPQALSIGLLAEAAATGSAPATPSAAKLRLSLTSSPQSTMPTAFASPSSFATNSLRFLQLVMQRFNNVARFSSSSNNKKAVASAAPATVVDAYEPNPNSFMTVALPPTEAAWTVSELFARSVLYSAAGRCPLVQDAIGSARVGHVFVPHAVTMLPKLPCFECDPTPSFFSNNAASRGGGGGGGVGNNSGGNGGNSTNRVNNCFALHGGTASGVDEVLSVGLLVPSAAMLSSFVVSEKQRRGGGGGVDASNNIDDAGGRGGGNNGGGSGAAINSNNSTVLRMFGLSAIGLQDIYCDAAVAADAPADLLLIPPSSSSNATTSNNNVNTAAQATDVYDGDQNSPRQQQQQYQYFSVSPAALLAAGGHHHSTGGYGNGNGGGGSSAPISTLYNGRSTAPSLYHLLHRHTLTATSFLWSQKGTAAGPEAKRLFHARYLSFVAARDLKTSLVDYSSFSPTSAAFGESPPFRTLQAAQAGNSRAVVRSLQPMMEASLGFTAVVPAPVLVRSIARHVALVPQYFNLSFERQRVLQIANAAQLAAEKEARARERLLQAAAEGNASVGGTASSSAAAAGKGAGAGAAGKAGRGGKDPSATPLTPAAAAVAANPSLAGAAAALACAETNPNNAMAKDLLLDVSCSDANPNTNANASAEAIARAMIRDRAREHEHRARTLLLNTAEMAPAQQPMILYASW